MQRALMIAGVTFVLMIIFVCKVYSQEEKKDSAIVLEEVVIRAFEENRPVRSAITPVHVLKIKNTDANAKTSFVSSFNTVPGVRMEERSPGSYRINIRGSSLRAPFGVRNVKVYWNDIPVTDAGGNTYFNQFAWNNIASMEIVKGPAGSMYGAGTGGVILLNPLGNLEPGISAEYITGSHNLNNFLTSLRFGKTENLTQFSFSHSASNGYREQSNMRRDNFSWVSRLKVSDRQHFSASVLFTDMFYQTPGALTKAEFNANPKSARPATGVFPSATDARASIKQLNFLAGFNHYYEFSSFVANQTCFYGSLAEINNPAIRNYERRTEPGFGGRSIFIFRNSNANRDIKIITGGEFQHGFFNTLVFKNHAGKPDTLQTNDDIVYTLNTYFIQADMRFKNSWWFHTGFSVNRSKVTFSRISQFPIITRNRFYRDEIAPRITIKKLFSDDLSLASTISRGFSPPTISELLPSTGVISTYLEAESGWNYEMVLDYYLLEKRLQLSGTAFYFKLKNALVQRKDSSGADYFVNAGNVKQTGLELFANYKSDISGGKLSNYELQAAFTFNHFRYGSFFRGSTDYSGKIIPSVPGHTVSLLMDLRFKKGVYATINYYRADQIFLNDENTAETPAYHLLAAKAGLKRTIKEKFLMNVYGGLDNILNEIYSLGNDINAPANRFYNAAPARSFYAGVSFQWLSPKNPPVKKKTRTFDR